MLEPTQTKAGKDSEFILLGWKNSGSSFLIPKFI